MNLILFQPLDSCFSKPKTVTRVDNKLYVWPLTNCESYTYNRAGIQTYLGAYHSANSFPHYCGKIFVSEDGVPEMCGREAEVNRPDQHYWRRFQVLSYGSNVGVQWTAEAVAEPALTTLQPGEVSTLKFSLLNVPSIPCIILFLVSLLFTFFIILKLIPITASALTHHIQCQKIKSDTEERK